MSGPMMGVTGIAVMLSLLFFLRIPAAFTMLLVGFFGFAAATSFDAACSMLGSELWASFLQLWLDGDPALHPGGGDCPLCRLQQRPLLCHLSLVRPLPGRACHDHHHGLRRFFGNQRLQHGNCRYHERRGHPGHEQIQVPSPS